MIRYLIKHNLYKLVRQKTVLGAIIILSLIVSTFGVLFFSGYFAYSYYDSLSGRSSNLSISVEPSALPQEIHAILKVVETVSTDDSISSITLSNGNLNNNYSDGNIIPAIGKYSKTEKEQLLLGRYFYEGENCPVVLLSETCASILNVSNMPLSEMIPLEDKQCRIIGILFQSDLAYVLPIDYYIDHFAVSKIDVSFSICLEKESVKTIDSLPKVISVEYSEPLSPFLSANFIPSLIQILLIYSFTFINIILVIKLWQQANLEQYKIYYCLGASTATIVMVAFWQIICISLSGVIIGCLLFLSLLPFFISYGILYVTTIDCLILVIIASVIIMLFSMMYCKKMASRLHSFQRRS